MRKKKKSRLELEEGAEARVMWGCKEKRLPVSHYL